MYSIHVAIVAGCLFIASIAFQNDVDKSTNEKLLMGRDYLEGGKEFYTKESRRGLLLRKGLGPQGEEYFDENGDPKRKWYEPEVSATPHSAAIKRIQAYETFLA